jgi:hypothetical protein
MGGTSTEMITQCIYLKLSATANCKRLLRNHWDLSAHFSQAKLSGKDVATSFAPAVNLGLFSIFLSHLYIWAYTA